MLKPLINNYIDKHDQIQLIGIITAILGGLISLFYVLYERNNVGLMVVVNGLLLTAVMMSATYHGHNALERNFYGLVTAVFSGITFGVGSFAAHSLLFTSLGIIIILPWLGLIYKEHPLLFWSLFFIFDGFILGASVPSPHDLHKAILFGIDYGVGGVIIIITGFVRIFIRARFFNIHEKLPFISNRKCFSINKYSLHYTIGMLLAVLISNFYAIYFKLPHGYWLPMTAFLLFKDSFSTSMQRLKRRFVGTALGGVAALIIFIFISNKVVFAVALFILLYFTIVAIAKHYGAYAFFLTLTVSILINLITPEGVSVVESRLVDTFLGVLIVIIVLHVIRFILGDELKTT